MRIIFTILIIIIYCNNSLASDYKGRLCRWDSAHTEFNITSGHFSNSKPKFKPEFQAVVPRLIEFNKPEAESSFDLRFAKLGFNLSEFKVSRIASLYKFYLDLSDKSISVYIYNDKTIRYARNLMDFISNSAIEDMGLFYLIKWSLTKEKDKSSCDMSRESIFARHIVQFIPLNWSRKYSKVYLLSDKQILIEDIEQKTPYTYQHSILYPLNKDEILILNVRYKAKM